MDCVPSLVGRGMLDQKESKFLEDLNNPNSELIRDLLFRYLPIPINGFNLVPGLHLTPYAYVDVNKLTFKGGIRMFLIDLGVMNFTDYLIKLKTSSYIPIFSVKSKYFSLTHSIKLLKEWFVFQFDQHARDIINSIFQLMNGVAGKRNCIWFSGPGNSGKTFVATSLCELMCIYGTLSNLKNGQQFPFQVNIHYK